MNIAKFVFGKEKLPKRAILFGGMIWRKSYIKNLLLNFETAEKVKDYPWKVYIVKKKNKKFLLAWGCYGSTLTLELIKILSAGGCKEIIFIGWAYTPFNIEINSIIVAEKIRSLDGLSQIITEKNLLFLRKN